MFDANQDTKFRPRNTPTVPADIIDDIDDYEDNRAADRYAGANLQPRVVYASVFSAGCLVLVAIVVALGLFGAAISFITS